MNIKKFKYIINSIKGFHFHDCHINKASVLRDDLLIELNHMDVLVNNKFNNFDSPKETGKALIIVKDFKINKMRRDYGTAIDSKGVKTEQGIITEDECSIDITKVISDTEILSLEQCKESKNKLLFIVDPYKDYLIYIDILYGEVLVCWDSSIKDSWFARN